MNNGQHEVLFPTNVEFEVKEIITRDSGKMDQEFFDNGFVYQIIVDETPTESIQKEVDGIDPNADEFICNEWRESSSDMSIISSNSEMNDTSTSSKSNYNNSTYSSFVLSDASKPLCLISPFIFLLFLCL